MTVSLHKGEIWRHAYRENARHVNMKMVTDEPSRGWSRLLTASEGTNPTDKVHLGLPAPTTGKVNVCGTLLQCPNVPP